MRALVTGADGFVGRWLVRHLESAGDQVWCAVGPDETGQENERTRAIDVRQSDDLDALCQWARPDAIYHLAGVAFGPDAQRATAHAVDVNVRGTVNVLETARALSTKPVVLVSGSADVYGDPQDSSPLTESDPVAPAHLYGGSKAAQEAIALSYHRAGLLDVVVTRSFNHIGPGQRDVFVVASLAGQLAAVAAGAAPVVRVGNLPAERDFTDVRDVVRAYRILVAGGHAGQPLNVASGHATSIDRVLQLLIEISGLDVEVEVDPARLRTSDTAKVVGDASRLTALTGWRPEIPLETTLRDVWADACVRIRVRA